MFIYIFYFVFSTFSIFLIDSTYYQIQIRSNFSLHIWNLIQLCSLYIFIKKFIFIFHFYFNKWFKNSNNLEI